MMDLRTTKYPVPNADVKPLTDLVVVHRPQGKPLSKYTASSESQGVKRTGSNSTLPAVPPSASRSTPSDELTGIPDKIDDQFLPDLVLEHEDPDTTQAISTEEEMDAVAALLSLGEMGNDTLDDNNENAELMPIGGQNVPLDIALQPIRLDQLNVDNAIAEMIHADDQSKDTSANTKTEEQVEVQTVAKPDDAKLDDTNKEIPLKQEVHYQPYHLLQAKTNKN